MGRVAKAVMMAAARSKRREIRKREDQDAAMDESLRRQRHGLHSSSSSRSPAFSPSILRRFPDSALSPPLLLLPFNSPPLPTYKSERKKRILILYLSRTQISLYLSAELVYLLIPCSIALHACSPSLSLFAEKLINMDCQPLHLSFHVPRVPRTARLALRNP